MYEMKNIRILTGSIAQILEWFPGMQIGTLFEVTGYVSGIFLQNPSILPCPGNELQFTIRDGKKYGLKLQVTQPYELYTQQRQQELRCGMRIRCIGRVLDLDGPRFLAFKVNVISDEEALDYNRVEHVCRSVANIN